MSESLAPPAPANDPPLSPDAPPSPPTEIDALKGEIVKLWEAVTLKESRTPAAPEPTRPAPEPVAKESVVKTTPEVKAQDTPAPEDKPAPKPKKRHAGLFW